MSLLEVEGLHAGYGPVQVLDGIDFAVEDGEMVVILGANGAGKTTTLRAVSGMIHGRGRVTLDGQNILGRRPEQVAKLGVAHVPQGRGTFSELTVVENLKLGSYARTDGAVATRMDKWFEVFPRLGDRRTQTAGSMSGGEQQMLAIARGLMCEPRLLLLDEPSLGLAPLVTQELFHQLTSINADLGTAMLIVEQNANLALDVAARAYVLETGRIVISGTAREVQEDDTVRRAYLGY